MTMNELVRAMWFDLDRNTVDHSKLTELLNRIESGETYDNKPYAAIVQPTLYVRKLPRAV